MFNDIPRSRMILYMVVVGLVPLLLVGLHLMSSSDAIAKFKDNVEEVENAAVLQRSRQAGNVAVIDHYSDFDRFYIDKQIESLTFLKPEIQGLEKIIQNKNYPDDESIINRYNQLTKGGNRLVFSEGAVTRYPLYQEVVETMVHPVEVNVDDIKTILSRIEGIKIGNELPPTGSPQLIITDFRLEKKKNNEDNDLFLLNMKLLKREFQ